MEQARGRGKKERGPWPASGWTGLGAGFLVLGLGWVVLGLGSFSISSSLLFLIQTKFEFKYKFEFKPHSNKICTSMNATQIFKPMIKF